MSAKKTIELGYEVGTGKLISVPLLNIAVTGQTQESGKTTTLEALATRSGATVLTFVTKRGEGSFSTGNPVQPYFRDRADWQFVMGLIETMMQEKNRFLRQYVIPLCRATRTLKEVRTALNTKLRKNPSGIYIEISAYLDLIIPEIERAKLAAALNLSSGLNVMDISDFNTPMQMLFVQSAIDWINDKERDTVVVIPEAWEFIPEGKGSPVKPSAISLVRKGSGIGNHIWIDSQDMAGVDKTILRGCPVWIIGVQREINEVKRNIANIPAPAGKPKPSDVQMLALGQFFACFGTTLAKVYIRPTWMAPDTARQISLGHGSSASAAHNLRGRNPTYRDLFVKNSPPPAALIKPEEKQVNETEAKELRETNERQAATINDLKHQIADLLAAKPKPTNTPMVHKATVGDESLEYFPDMDAIYTEVKRRAAADPGVLKILASQPEITVTVERKEINTSEDTLLGKIGLLIKEGYFDNVQTGNAAFNELKRRGQSVAKPSVYRECDKVAAAGFLTKESDGYKAVASMKVNVVRR